MISSLNLQKSTTPYNSVSRPFSITQASTPDVNIIVYSLNSSLPHGDIFGEAVSAMSDRSLPIGTTMVALISKKNKQLYIVGPYKIDSLYQYGKNDSSFINNGLFRAKLAEIDDTARADLIKIMSAKPDLFNKYNDVVTEGLYVLTTPDNVRGFKRLF